jgi:hypothetical protein
MHHPVASHSKNTPMYFPLTASMFVIRPVDVKTRLAIKNLSFCFYQQKTGVGLGSHEWLIASRLSPNNASNLGVTNMRQHVTNKRRHMIKKREHMTNTRECTSHDSVSLSQEVM